MNDYLPNKPTTLYTLGRTELGYLTHLGLAWTASRVRSDRAYQASKQLPSHGHAVRSRCAPSQGAMNTLQHWSQLRRLGGAGASRAVSAGIMVVGTRRHPRRVPSPE